MSWSTPADLRAQLNRLWERGELLRSLEPEASAWPLRLGLKGPTSIELTEHFEAVRSWVAELAAMPHIRIEWRDVRHRIQGRQRLPEEVWIDDADDALALIGKRREARIWRQLRESTGAELPLLLPWLTRRPLQALDLADRWSRLLSVMRWAMAHPRSGIYLRQVDVPGVDSKFIETHRAVLAEWLDLVLPAEAIDAAATGMGQFARRYGFRDKPVRIRFRVLDPRLHLLPGEVDCPDVTLDAASFAALVLPVGKVFITENETNFLAFPAVRDAIVVFGTGYGWDALSRAAWLSRCAIHYWGDIDTHGFAILDQLRSRFPQVESFLMDRETLLAHEALWGDEPDPVRHDLERLTADERALFDDLRDHRLRQRLRLEQERVGFQWLTAALARIESKDRGSPTAERQQPRDVPTFHVDEPVAQHVSRVRRDPR